MTTTTTTTVAALVPIDHHGVIYRRAQILDVDPQLAASLIDRGIAQDPRTPVEVEQRRASEAHATYAIEPTTGPPALPAEFVEITLLRSGAYNEIDGHYCTAGSRWLVAPSVARQLQRTGDAETIEPEPAR